MKIFENLRKALSKSIDIKQGTSFEKKQKPKNRQNEEKERGKKERLGGLGGL